MFSFLAQNSERIEKKFNSQPVNKATTFCKQEPTRLYSESGKETKSETYSDCEKHGHLDATITQDFSTQCKENVGEHVLTEPRKCENFTDKPICPSLKHKPF